MEIAVLGGGNGSLAAAVDLTEQGHRVRLWRRDAATVMAMPNPLKLQDHTGMRPITIALITDDLGDALAGAELVVCPTPATAQEDIAARLAPLLTDGQVVFMPPGTFGSYVMARAPRLPTGVLPLRLKDHALALIRQAYPSVEDAGDALSGALMNAGPIIHPPLIIMNAGPIEHFEHWDIHNEGTQPSIRRVTTALDAERMAVREALGYGAPHFPLANHYDNEAEEWMYGNLAHEKLTESGDWRERLVLTEHRYMREDVAMGLAFLVSAADWAGVPCPVARGLLAIGSAICGEDFRQTGRTLESLGLAGLSRAEMAAMLEHGL